MTTNEPAFPSTKAPTTAPEIYYGITIRDYFAAKAMQSYLLDKDRDSFTFEQWATASYKMADAMLKARSTEYEMTQQEIEYFAHKVFNYGMLYAIFDGRGDDDKANKSYDAYKDLILQFIHDHKEKK